MPPTQPIFLTDGLAVMPDMNGVINALHAIHRGDLSPSLSSEAITFIGNILPFSAIGDKVNGLLRTLTFL